MTNHASRLAAVAVPLLLLLTTTSWAQESGTGDSTDRGQVFSTNPLTMVLLSWYNGEYERQLTQAATLGLSGSRLSFDGDDAFVSVNAAFRYYPGGTALSGFYLGPRVGLFHRNIYAAPESGMDVDEYETPDSDMEGDDDSGLFLGAGVELGYAWLLGVEKHLSISMGGGATRVFNGEAVPMIRFVNVGWAF